MSAIDTGYYTGYITAERLSAFQFTNAYTNERFVAVYSQQSNVAKTSLSGITAGISKEIYITMLFAWLAITILFAIIEYFCPSCDSVTGFNWFNIGTAVMPWSNSQAPSLEHSNSLARCVAIITANIFVFLATNYYQTLLLGNRYASDLFIFLVSFFPISKNIY
jgi:hypothetical protein